MRQVTLPGTDIRTTVLGFGTAALMGKLNEKESMRLLQVAYDQGVRHFDTAPLYGYGESEQILGEFLRSRPDATVATKFGLTSAAQKSVVLRQAKRLVRPLLRGLPNVRTSVGALVRSGMAPVSNFNPAAAAQSLSTSLRRLHRDRIDIFLLHECRQSDLEDVRLLEFLEDARVRGAIRAFGVATDIETVKFCLRSARGYAEIVQFANNRDQPHLERIGSLTARAACITHTPFGGTGHLKGGDDSASYLQYAVEQNANGIVLFSSQSEGHIVGNIRYLN